MTGRLIYGGDSVKQYDDSAAEEHGADGKHEDFRRELKHLINRYSQENGSDTPDFILAEYLTECLSLFDNSVKRRDIWWGQHKDSGSS